MRLRKLKLAIFGVPFGDAHIREELETFLRLRDVHAVRAIITDNIAHNTSKSGALLQAQGIFMVVATALLSGHWTRILSVTAIVLLIVAALGVLTNLRTVFIGPGEGHTDDDSAERDIVLRTTVLSVRRGVVFNIALYMTFLSILLLGIGAVLLEI